MKIHRKGREIPPFKLEKAAIGTSHLQDDSVTAAKIADGTTSLLTVAETEVFNAAAPTTWTDLDLSSTIGSNAALVLLKVITAASARATAFRKNGDTDEFYGGVGSAYGVALGNPDNAIHCVYLVATDSTGKVEWCQQTVAQTTVIDVMAYVV